MQFFLISCGGRNKHQVSRSIGVRAVQNRFATLEPTERLVQVEATDLKEIIDTQVHGTIFKADNKNVCGISKANCQRLKQSV